MDGSTGNMSMYFGCATRRNVAAYACYFVLLAVGIAMLLSWFFVSRTCGVEVSSCMQGVSSIQPFRQGMVVNYRNLGALNVTTVCEGLVDGAAQVRIYGLTETTSRNCTGFLIDVVLVCFADVII